MKLLKNFQNARWKENQTFRGASSVFFRGLKAFWLSDFKPITEREHSLHLKHLLVSLSLHAYFEKRSLDFHRLEKGRLPKPFLRVPLKFVRPLFRKGWNLVSFDQDKWLFKLSLLLKMLLNAFYKSRSLNEADDMEKRGQQAVSLYCRPASENLRFSTKQS